MNLFLFLLGVLTVWRLTHLLHAEDGPWDLLARLRGRAGNGFWAGLLDCFYCLSLWTAVPVAFVLGKTWKQTALMWLPLSAGAILIERFSSSEHSESEVHYLEDKEVPDVVLRSEAKDAGRDVRRNS